MTYTPILPLALLSTWLTPLWLLSLGAALGLAALGLGYGVLRLAAPRGAAAAISTVRESVLLPIAYLAIFMTVFVVVGTVVVPYRALLSSAGRMFKANHAESEFKIDATTTGQIIPLIFDVAEVRSFTLQTDHPVTIFTKVVRGAGENGEVRLKPGTPFEWRRPSTLEAPFEPDMRDWSVRNSSGQSALLRVEAQSDVRYPEVRAIPITAAALVGLFAVYLLLQWAMPKISAIALSTAKEAISQPLFYLLMTIGVVLLLAFIFVPYYTLGEDVKMLKDSGMALILALAIIIAVWSASVGIAEEIEGRTALTVLSKPVGRYKFILGKFFGILGPVVLMFVMLGTLFLITVSYKVVYDAKESAQPEPSWQVAHLEIVRTVPGLVLAFLETIVMAAISVAISTRLPMLANLVVCSSIYVLGHLVPMLVNSSAEQFEIVGFFGKFFGTVLPVLDHFNIQAAVAAGAAVPLEYLAWALLYCVLYSSIALLIGLAMFEDRDLA